MLDCDDADFLLARYHYRHDGHLDHFQLLMLADVHGFQLQADLRAVAEVGARFSYSDAPDSHVGAASNPPEAQGATAMRDVPRCAPSSTDYQALALAEREAPSMGLRMSRLRAISKGNA